MAGKSVPFVARRLNDAGAPATVFNSRRWWRALIISLGLITTLLTAGIAVITIQIKASEKDLATTSPNIISQVRIAQSPGETLRVNPDFTGVFPNGSTGLVRLTPDGEMRTIADVDVNLTLSTVNANDTGLAQRAGQPVKHQTAILAFSGTVANNDVTAQLSTSGAGQCFLIGGGGVGAVLSFEWTPDNTTWYAIGPNFTLTAISDWERRFDISLTEFRITLTNGPITFAKPVYVVCIAH
jgi:hypothetical protein